MYVCNMRKTMQVSITQTYSHTYTHTHILMRSTATHSHLHTRAHTHTLTPMDRSTPNSHEFSLTFAVNDNHSMKKQRSIATAPTMEKNRFIISTVCVSVCMCYVYVCMYGCMMYVWIYDDMQVIVRGELHECMSV